MKIFLFFTSVLLFLVGTAAKADDVQTREKRLIFRQKLQDASRREEAIKGGLVSADAVIRSRALLFYVQDHGADNAWETLLKMADDRDSQVLEVLVSCGMQLTDTLKRQELMSKITKSPVACTAKYRASKSTFGFHRDNKRLKDSGSFDHEIVIAKSFQIPDDQWKFRTDTANLGHRNGWYAPELDETEWKPIKMGAWESQGFTGYDGIAWYRIRFKMPEKSPHEAVELHFHAVDEGAWVWLNGTYIGQHDEGPGGWAVPFWLDVTNEIRWGAENILVVRVEDTEAAGGIWKPVNVEILKGGDN